MMATPSEEPFAATQLLGKPFFADSSQACDCHMHLFDLGAPFIANALMPIASATPQQYLELQKHWGMTRCVIVQPSCYGTDHRVLLSGLLALGSRAKAIAVVTPATSDSELQALADAGVVGARLNLVQHGVTDETMLEPLVERIQAFGWHLQMHLKARDLVRLAPRIKALSVHVVIDHIARLYSEASIAPQVIKTVEDLLATDRVWLKLSAPYLASGRLDFGDLASAVPALVRQFSHRIVWGSDWPHVTEGLAAPSDHMLLSTLLQWIPDETSKARIWCENPKTLYGFAS